MKSTFSKGQIQEARNGKSYIQAAAGKYQIGDVWTREGQGKYTGKTQKYIVVGVGAEFNVARFGDDDNWQQRFYVEGGQYE